MWPLLLVPTSERGNSGGKTRGPGPHFPWKTSRNPSSVKRVRGSDPSHRPRPRGSRGGNGEVPPLPEGPRGRGPHRTRPAEGLATESSPTRGGGVRATRKGGGASRARALAECPDAALRQSGPHGRAGNPGGKATDAERVHPCLTFQIAQELPSYTCSPSVKGLRREDLPPRARRQSSETRWRHGFPLPPFATVSRLRGTKISNTRSAPGLTDTQNRRWAGTKPRVGAPLPPRALTYRLRPCRRTRALADTQRDPSTTEHRRLED